MIARGKSRSKPSSSRTHKRRYIKKSKGDSGMHVWCRIDPPLPVKHLLIMPGDCIVPMNTLSMSSLFQEVYAKNSSTKSDHNLELCLFRKIKPYRDAEELFPLLDRVNSQFLSKVKELITSEYYPYISKMKAKRLQVTQTKEYTTSLPKSVNSFDNALAKFLKQLPDKFYRYQLRSSNEDTQMQIKKLGIGRDLLNLLEPEFTDILLQDFPKTFKDVHNYFKYMYFNLHFLVSGKQMDWVPIELETSDEIVIETRFKNVYFQSPTSTRLATITLFDVPKGIVERVQRIRKQAQAPQNVLMRVDPKAEFFFDKFYSIKDSKSKRRCDYSDISQRDQKPIPIKQSNL